MPNRISNYWVLVQLWICHVWKDVGLFLRSLYFIFCFYCVFVLLFCCFVYWVSFCAVFFSIFVQVYRPLPPGGNPIAINKYHININTSQARGLKDRNPFTQRVLQQDTNVRLQLTFSSPSRHFYHLRNAQRFAVNTRTWTPVPTTADM